MRDRPNSDTNRVSPLWSEAATYAVELLTHYGFDLGGSTAEALLDRWQAEYPPTWIRWAVIEALYQGRYKAISVAQILQHWQRRQQARYHFNYEFERMVCQRFPRNLAAARESTPSSAVHVADSVALPSLNEPPWAELAQIQQNEPPSIEHQATASLHGNVPVQSEPIPVLEPLEPPEALMHRVARLQAGVDALIEQATSSLNASTDAMKTKLQLGDASPKAIQNGKPPAIEPEEHPPIDQFTPLPDGSEFHSKLKAVAEQEE